MKLSPTFQPMFMVGLAIALFGFLLGGYGNHPTQPGLFFFTVGIGLLGLSSLLIPNRTIQLLTGLTMLGYGIWWVLMPQIETKVNMLCICLIAVGAIVLVRSITRPPPNSRLNKTVFFIYLAGAIILMALVYVEYGDGPMP